MVFFEPTCISGRIDVFVGGCCYKSSDSSSFSVSPCHFCVDPEKYFLLNHYLLCLAGDIYIKSLEESLCSELQVKASQIEIASNIKVVIEEEDKEQNVVVMAGKLNPEEKIEEKMRTIKAEAMLGSVKFDKKDWFSSLKLS